MVCHLRRCLRNRMDQRRYRRTIHLDSKSNTPRLISALNCVNYQRKRRLLGKIANFCELEQPVVFCTNIKQVPNKNKIKIMKKTTILLIYSMTCQLTPNQIWSMKMHQSQQSSIRVSY